MMWNFNKCFLCGCEEENVNHILLHCIVVRVLWEIVLALFGANWVFPKTVKEMLFSWRGPFVGEKRKKIWTFIPLCIFWTVWKERNRLAFRRGSLASFFYKQMIYIKRQIASRHTGSIRDYHPLKQKTTRPKPYLEANHSKKPIRDFDSISMYILAHPRIMYTSEVFKF